MVLHPGLVGMWSYRSFVSLRGNPTQLHVLAPPGNAMQRAATSLHSQDAQIWADFACLCFGLVPGSSPSCSNMTNMLYLRHLWKYKGHCSTVCECRACSKQQTHPAHPRTCFHVVSMHSVLGEAESRSSVTPVQSSSFCMLEPLL